MQDQLTSHRMSNGSRRIMDLPVALALMASLALVSLMPGYGLLLGAPALAESPVGQAQPESANLNDNLTSPRGEGFMMDPDTELRAAVAPDITEPADLLIGFGPGEGINEVHMIRATIASGDDQRVIGPGEGMNSILYLGAGAESESSEVARITGPGEGLN